MKCKVISVDLAKDVFELAIASPKYKVLERKRLNRAQFKRFITNHPQSLIIMEACGTAHYWGRISLAAGHRVELIPPHYVKPYRRRGKSDRIDTDAIIEAHRCEGITPVPVSSLEQQQIQQLHRIREQWKKTRTQRINALRGFLRELGYAIPVGPNHIKRRVIPYLEDDGIPGPLKSMYAALLTEIEELTESIRDAEREIVALTKHNGDIQRLQEIPGIGVLTSTALVASVGSAHRFSTGRKLSSWIGLTPREHSSGNTRFLGGISKQGDSYVRMLLTHGARSVLRRSKQLHTTNEPMTPLQRWVCQLERRVGHNKATCAIANKLIRLCWAVLTTGKPYDTHHGLAQ